MKIVDLYSSFHSKLINSKVGDLEKLLESDPSLNAVISAAKQWEVDLSNVERWMRSPEYHPCLSVAHDFISDLKGYIKIIEEFFNESLQGELWLIPSLMTFDGFAKFDSGTHRVWLGIDHPDADINYLMALLAHELSHVYRDHQPLVWEHLGKPISQASRSEYLEAGTWEEHLISEGLATLASQAIFPRIQLHTHHFYFVEEMQWCLMNEKVIDAKMRECLKTDKNVWQFYEEGLIDGKSPSRIHYYWAAKSIANWLSAKGAGDDFNKILLESHKWPSSQFECFNT